MTHALRIVVADDERDVREHLQRALALLGHEVVAVTEDGPQLVERCRVLRPDLVIADIKMPGLDGIAAAEAICRERPTPVILVTGHEGSEFIARAIAGPVLNYLIKPVKQAHLAPAVALAMRRFEQIQALATEAAAARQALEDRKVVERAKGIVMKRLRVEEPEAYRRLQKLASIRNRKLLDVAQAVLAADEAFQALERA